MNGEFVGGLDIIKVFDGFPTSKFFLPIERFFLKKLCLSFYDFIEIVKQFLQNLEVCFE